MHSTGYKKGQWLAICQRCGFEYHSAKIRQEWTGLRVCCGPDTNNCWEPRHPQESVRARADKQTPPWASPEPEDLDVSPGSGNEISADDL